MQAYTDSMELAPLNPATYSNLAHAFREGDRLKEAKHAYRGAARVIMSPGCEGDFAGKQSMADGLRIRTSTLLPRVIQSQVLPPRPLAPPLCCGCTPSLPSLSTAEG